MIKGIWHTFYYCRTPKHTDIKTESVKLLFLVVSPFVVVVLFKVVVHLTDTTATTQASSYLLLWPATVLRTHERTALKRQPVGDVNES